MELLKEHPILTKSLRIDMRRSTEPLVFCLTQEGLYTFKHLYTSSFIFNCTTVNDLEFLRILHLNFRIVCRSKPCKTPKREFIELGEMKLKIYKSLGPLNMKDVKNVLLRGLHFRTMGNQLCKFLHKSYTVYFFYCI